MYSVRIKVVKIGYFRAFLVTTLCHAAMCCSRKSCASTVKLRSWICVGRGEENVGRELSCMRRSWIDTPGARNLSTRQPWEHWSSEACSM
jgi:hypothetical protein